LLYAHSTVNIRRRCSVPWRNDAPPKIGLLGTFSEATTKGHSVFLCPFKWGFVGIFCHIFVESEHKTYIMIYNVIRLLLSWDYVGWDWRKWPWDGTEKVSHGQAWKRLKCVFMAPNNVGRKCTSSVKQEKI